MNRIALGLLALISFGPAALGETIAAWNLTGTAGSQAAQAALSPNPTHALGSAMMRGAGVTATLGANSFNSNSWNTAAAANPALDTEYVSFGFTVQPGFTIDLTNLTLGTQSSATGPGTMGLFYSGNGFATPVHTFVQPSGTLLNTVVNLATLPNLTGVIEFRFIEIGNTAPNAAATQGGGTFRVAENSNFPSAFDVNFTGTAKPVAAAVPLPSAVYGGLALMGLCAIGRKKVFPSMA